MSRWKGNVMLKSFYKRW